MACYETGSGSSSYSVQQIRRAQRRIRQVKHHPSRLVLLGMIPDRMRMMLLNGTMGFR